LAEQGGTWFYKRNLSPINYMAARRSPDGASYAAGIAARFGTVEQVSTQPAPVASPKVAHQLLDLAGDGQLDLVELAGVTPGFYERTNDGTWDVLAPFEAVPVLDWNDSALRFVDLTGDGRADILAGDDDAFCWHAGLGEAGFGPARRVPKRLDEEEGPAVALADGT